jgi:hypothetical protein
MTPTQEAFLLVSLWVIAHGSMVGVLHQRTRKLAPIVCGLLLVLVYLVKPATGDLWSYSFFFDTGFSQISHEKEDVGDLPPRTASIETGYSRDAVDPAHISGEPYLQRYKSSPLFARLVRLSAEFFPHGSSWPRFQAFGFRAVSDWFLIEVILLGVIGIWASLFFDAKRLKTRPIKLWEWLPVVLGSVFFFVGSQNSVRQFFALVAVLITCAAFRQKQYLWSMLFALIGTLLHQAGLAFVTLALAISFGVRYLTEWRIERQFVREVLLVAYGTLIGMGLLLFVKSMTWLNVQEISQYAFLPDASDTHRTGALSKLLIIGMLLVVSELIMGWNTDDLVGTLRRLRVAIFFAIAPLVSFSELFARVLMLYFAFEMILIVVAFSSNKIRYVLAGLTIFLTYSGAPNVINNLTGVGWRELIQKVVS